MPIASLFTSWSSVFADHAAVRTIVGFVHLAGLIGGGGVAIAADRATIRAARQDAAARAGQLAALRTTHRVVVAGLSALFLSGVLLLAADLETYALSTIFWLKMVLVAMLLANGVFILIAERDARRGVDSAWERLPGLAMTSLVLWFLTTLAGAALPNIG